MSTIERMRNEAVSLDERVGRAAALHNLNEYAYLRGKRDGVEWCLKLLRGVEVVAK